MIFVVILALLTSQVNCDSLGRAIRIGPLMKATLSEYEAKGNISDVEPLIDTIRAITAKNGNDCVLYKNGKCLLVLQPVLNTTTQKTTLTLQTPRHTESFPAASEAKTFLKDRLIALVQKSYPTIKKMVEGFYSPSATSLLAANTSDTKLWAKRLSASVNMVNVRMVERLEGFIAEIQRFKRPSLAILVISIVISFLLFTNCIYKSIVSGVEKYRQAQNRRFDEYYQGRQEEEHALRANVRAIAPHP